MSFEKTTLAAKTPGEREQLSNCVRLLLLWVAASDGRIDESELDFASSNFPETEDTVATSDLLEVIRTNDLHAMERAIRAVTEQSREMRTAFLDMAITMAMADHEIAISENHILRFYAEALYLGDGMLEKRFQAISGSALSMPADPGSPDWWKKHEAEIQDSVETNESAKRGERENAMRSEPKHPEMTVEQAREILGVGADANQVEIERAYRSFAAIFQVQRVESMGNAAVSVASRQLQKIEEAYGLLQD